MMAALSALPPDARLVVTESGYYSYGELARVSLPEAYTVEGDGPRITVRRFREFLPAMDGAPGVAHDILEASDDAPLDNTPEFRVPAGHVFAMGDNRDNSLDSRAMNAVGFIPMENLVGRAEFIFLSVDGSAAWWQVWGWPFAIRWSRLFSAVR